jgi:hypothetical protein
VYRLRSQPQRSRSPRSSSLTSGASRPLPIACSTRSRENSGESALTTSATGHPAAHAACPPATTASTPHSRAARSLWPRPSIRTSPLPMSIRMPSVPGGGASVRPNRKRRPEGRPARRDPDTRVRRRRFGVP